MELREWLIARYEDEGANGTAFARKLGIHQTTWWKFQHSERGAGFKVIAAALKAFPEHRQTILLLAFDHCGTPEAVA